MRPELTIMRADHIHDDDLDLYAMRRMYALDRKRLEEHLLLCGHCQSRLAAIESLIEALRLHRGQTPNV